ncbi:hypothetical protein CWS72_15590 [Telmatospirillum siberiense]|uniref:Uncharacterized protein n=1 Tax=Telmatospirillum siberiense TaxID=382514 RepID=A0A2N3PTF4_9PROT|nr:hypothetical protein CWS72_15590 [Telmatospirillum siberiense]
MIFLWRESGSDKDAAVDAAGYKTAEAFPQGQAQHDRAMKAENAKLRFYTGGMPVKMKRCSTH